MPNNSGNDSAACPFSWPNEPLAEDIPILLTFGEGDRHYKGRDLAWDGDG